MFELNLWVLLNAIPAWCACLRLCHFSIDFYSNKQLLFWLQFNHILNRKHVAKIPLRLTFEFKWLCHFHKSFYHTVLSYMLNSYLWRWCFLLFSSAYQKLSPCLTESLDSLLIYPIHGTHWPLTLFIFAVILATLSLKDFSDFHSFELSSGAGINWQGINVFNQWQRLLSLNLSCCLGGGKLSTNSQLSSHWIGWLWAWFCTFPLQLPTSLCSCCPQW